MTEVALDAATLDLAAVRIANLAGRISDIAKDAQPTTCIAGISGTTTALIESGSDMLMTIADSLPLQCAALTTAATKMQQVGGMAAADAFLRATPLASPYLPAAKADPRAAPPLKKGHKLLGVPWFLGGVVSGVAGTAWNEAKSVPGGVVKLTKFQLNQMKERYEHPFRLSNMLTLPGMMDPGTQAKMGVGIVTNIAHGLKKDWHENPGKALGSAATQAVLVFGPLAEVFAPAKAVGAAGEVATAADATRGAGLASKATKAARGAAGSRAGEILANASGKIDPRVYADNAAKAGLKAMERTSQTTAKSSLDTLSAQRGQIAASPRSIDRVQALDANRQQINAVTAARDSDRATIKQLQDLLAKINSPNVRLAEDWAARAGESTEHLESHDHEKVH